MRSNFKAILAASVGLATVYSSPGFAQSDDGADSGEIIVTARRVEERLQDVPISITVLNQDQIDDRNMVLPSDLAIYTPSLTVNQRFGPETSSFAIRGFLQEANTAPSVGVYFAEVTTPRSLGLTAAGSNLAIGSMMDLQNLQVLKGPQGTLFGRNTTGGAILVVPTKPTDRLEGYVEASAGDYGMIRGQAVLNVPLADTFKVRIGVDRMKRDGYMKNKSGIGPKDYNDTNYTYVRASIVADLTPDLENYTTAHYSKSDTNGFAAKVVLCERDLLTRTQLGAAIFVAPGACEQIDRQNARGDGRFDVDIPTTDPYFKIEQWQFINHTTWHASDNLVIKNIASYSDINSDLQYRLGGDNFFSRDTGLGLPVPLALGLPFTSTDIASAPNGNHTADQWTFTEELQFQGNSDDGRLTWQVGGYLEISRSPSWNEGYINIFLNCPNEQIQALQCFDLYGFGDAPNPRQKAGYNNKAAYAQASYDITDKLTLTGGIRYTIDKVTAINEATRFLFPLTAPGTVVRRCNDSLAFPDPNGGGAGKIVTSPAECHREFEIKSERPTWLLNVDYKATDDLMVYAKWARGYRAGGIAVLNLGLEAWEPEKLDSYEVGIKASFRGPVRGYFNAAAFYNDLSDQQLLTTTLDKVTKVAQGNAVLNAGKSTIKGIEIDAAATFFDSLNLSVGYTYLDTKIDSLIVPTSPIYDIEQLAREGDPLPQVPKNRVTASAKYTLPFDESIGTLSVGATFVHTDRQFFNRNSRPDLLYLAATDIVNLNVNWDNVAGAPIDLSVFVTNLTDELVPVVNGGQYGSLGYESQQYAPPRMWGARVRYKFGN